MTAADENPRAKAEVLSVEVQEDGSFLIHARLQPGEKVLPLLAIDPGTTSVDYLGPAGAVDRQGSPWIAPNPAAATAQLMADVAGHDSWDPLCVHHGPNMSVSAFCPVCNPERRWPQ